MISGEKEFRPIGEEFFSPNLDCKKMLLLGILAEPAVIA